MPPVELHPGAIADARAGRRFYRRRSPQATARFTLALEAAVTGVALAPAAGSPHNHGTRRWPLKRFPFYLVYVERPADVLVLAVAHNKRRPGYWLRRTRRP